MKVRRLQAQTLLQWTQTCREVDLSWMSSCGAYSGVVMKMTTCSLHRRPMLIRKEAVITLKQTWTVSNQICKWTLWKTWTNVDDVVVVAYLPAEWIYACIFELIAANRVSWLTREQMLLSVRSQIYIFDSRRFCANRIVLVTSRIINIELLKLLSCNENKVCKSDALR